MEPYWLLTQTRGETTRVYNLYFVNKRGEHPLFLCAPSIEELTTRMAQQGSGPCLEDEVRTLVQPRSDVGGTEDAVNPNIVTTMRRSYERKVLEAHACERNEQRSGW